MSIGSVTGGHKFDIAEGMRRDGNQSAGRSEGEVP